MRILMLIAIFLFTNFGIVQAANYQLEGVVVFSRHNLRAPTRTRFEMTKEMTPHKWFKWTARAGELSIKGGELETIMGQYFRQWLTKENLIPENYIPAEGEVRFYANSYQRTIATAQFFSSGFLPVANVKVERKFAPSKMEDNFNGILTFANENFLALANEQINAALKANDFTENYKLLEKVIDFKNSDYAKKNNMTTFTGGDTKIFLELNQGPSLNGNLTLAVSPADALTLQYYEMDNATQAAFGKKLSFNDWKKIVDIVQGYHEILLTAPAVAVNVSHPLLKVLGDELSLKNRKFSFVCGHDSNITPLLAALGVEKYSLPQTLETKTPIGVKFVIEKYLGDDGKEYAKLSLIYASSEQIRNKTTLTLDNPPMIFPLNLNGLQKNSDGLYTLKEVQQRFDDAYNAYYDLQAESKAA